MSRNHRTVTIRLNGIDAPEKGQAYGHRSREFVSLQVFGTNVTVQTYGRDKYGRTIGDVYLPDGTMLNKEVVKEELAWWYCKYSVDQLLAQLEIEAREAKRGLWQAPKPVPPWVFRKRQRGQSVSRDEMSCFPTMPRPLEGVQPPLQPGPHELAPCPWLAISVAANTICHTAQPTARSTWRIVWSSPARPKRKRRGIEWRGIVGED